MKKNNRQHGFTLIELMVVITIIGILAATAIPPYLLWAQSAKVTEAFSLSATARSQIADFYRKTGDLPVDNTAAGLSPPSKFNGKYIKQLTVENGVIVLIFRQSIGHLSGKVLSLHPRIVIDSPTTPLAFHCGKVSKALPKGVVVIGKNQTTLTKKLLPRACR